MPIDRRKSHSNIVKELVDEYKSTGKIGSTQPRDLDHALSIANAIAYKSKKESKDLRLLSAVKKINQDENARQLSLLNPDQNVAYFLSDLSRSNWQEIHACAESFYSNYMSHTKRILKKWDLTEVQFSEHKFLAPLSFDQKFMLTEKIMNFDVYMGYKHFIGSRLEVAMQSSCAKSSTSNFVCTFDDSGWFFIKPTETYRKYIQSQLDQLM